MHNLQTERNELRQKTKKKIAANMFLPNFEFQYRNEWFLIRSPFGIHVRGFNEAVDRQSEEKKLHFEFDVEGANIAFEWRA